MTVTAQNIHDDVLANLGNRADLVEARVYRMIHYSQLAIARLTKWRDLMVINSFTHSTWAGVSLVADQTLQTTFVTSLSSGSLLRSVISFYLADYPENKHNRLKRVSTYQEWDGFRFPRVGSGAHRDTPTHYFFPSKDAIEFYPVADKVYDFQFRGIRYPTEVTLAGAANPLDIKNADDLVMARSTFVIAAGLNMPEVARMWKDEYNSMLQDLYRADRDLGDLDAAAFRQESNLSSNTQWWTDPFADQNPGGWNGGEQV